MQCDKIVCGLITRDTNWFLDTFFSVEEIALYELDPSHARIPLPNPYGLNFCDQPDVLIIDTSYYMWLIAHTSDDPVTVYEKLRKIPKYKVIIGTEGTDWFHLARPSLSYELCDIVLKAQGVYKDLELYNYVSGSCSTNRHWGTKTIRSDRQYPINMLEKLRLSLPCFITIHPSVRNNARKQKKHISYIQKQLRHAGDIWSEIETTLLRGLNKKPTKFAHFIGSLTHVQRLEMLLHLSNFRSNSTFGITGLEKYVWGMEHGRSPMPDNIREQLLNLLKKDDLLLSKRVNRNAFKRNLISHRVILAPTGFGELTYRHAEGWNTGRLVVCQELSHVEMMLEVRDRSNAVFCHSDFSDLAERLADIQYNEKNYEQVAENGLRAWKNWVGNYRDTLRKGVTDHIYSAIS